MSRGGKRKGAGAKPLPERLKKKPLTLSLEQWKIDALFYNYKTAKAIREVFDEFTNTLIS